MRHTARIAIVAGGLLIAAGGARAQSRGGEPPVPSLGPSPSFGSTAEDVERIREKTQQPVAPPSAGAFDAAIARQQRDQARRDLQVLEQRQQTFERTLPTPERERLEPRLRELERMRERARTQLRDMDTELARPEPDRDRVRAQREDLERDLDLLELEYERLRTP